MCRRSTWRGSYVRSVVEKLGREVEDLVIGVVEAVESRGDPHEMRKGVWGKA